MENLDKALMKLLPNGGWSCSDSYESIAVDDDIVKPTLEEVEIALIEVDRLEPIKTELQELDIKLPRFAEAYYLQNPEVDSYLTTIANRKKTLRDSL